MTKKIILVGYMGSGKSIIATNLAKRLNIKAIDLDRHIENTTKSSIPEIFKEKGEIYFRKLETEQLKLVLSQPGSWVLSLGGGTPCYGNNMERIIQAKDVTTIYLHAGISSLAERLFPQRKKRPLIAHLNTPELLKDYIAKHLFERSYYYNRADRIVHTDNKSVSEITEEILKDLL